MAIKYAQLINSFVSTEGSNGFMTNYVYYTLLVADTDGSKQIVEGKLHQISYLLPFVRTPIDEIAELKETVKNLRKDVNEIADQKVKYVVDSIFPIPDILNKNEVEAIELLEKAGLQPVLLNQYPENTPKNGVVQAFTRNSENFKKVDVTIIHNIPEITGLKIEDAQEQLNAAGFDANITYKTVTGGENGTVLECTRPDMNKLAVKLVVCSAIPETEGLPRDEAEKLLKEAGFEANITHKIVSGEENGIVLECTRPDVNKRIVNLVVGSVIPEITGLPIEEAERLLKEVGCQSVVVKRVYPEKPGYVIRWESVDENTVKILVGIPAKYETKHVDVKWSEMQDSTGDVYSATAEFDNKSQSLKVRLTYMIGAKTKHLLIGADVVSNTFVLRHPIELDENMETNVQNTVTIDIPFGKAFSSPPKDIELTLETLYGLMRKKELVDLQLTFEW